MVAWSFVKAAAWRAEAESARLGRWRGDPKEWIGEGASWDERRVFDWTYLAATCARGEPEAIAANADIAAHALMRAEEIIAKAV